MRSNIFKYLFILIVIILMGVSIYLLYGKKEETTQVQEPKEQETVTMITTIRVPIVEFDTINPILSKNQNVQDIAKLIYEPLVHIDEKGKVILCLASEWSKISQTSYVIKLKKDIKWQDGNLVTAKDVQYTIDRLKDSSVSSIYAWNVKDVVGVDVIDDLTIRINLGKEVPFFEYNLTFPIMSHSYYEGENFVTTSKNDNPIGTGRFKVVNEGGNITLKQNQNWWNLQQDPMKLTQIKVIKYGNMGEVYNAFKSGNIDLFTTQSLNLEEYIGTLGYQVKGYKGRELDFLAMNCENAILQDQEVRQAIHTAIDKNNIISAVYADQYYCTNFPLDFGSYVYETGKVTWEFNQEKAKEHLIQGGWEYKSKNWQKVKNYRTQKIKLDFVVKASNEARVQVAQIIKNQLEEIGMKINLIKASDSQYQNYLKNKNYDLILTGIYYSYSPDLTTFLGEGNLANYHNEEVSSLLQEVNSIIDEKLLQEKYNRLEEIYAQELPYACLYYNRASLVVSTNLVGDIKPNSYQVYQDIATWYRQ